jgi:hypothetical protein
MHWYGFSGALAYFPGSVDNLLSIFLFVKKIIYSLSKPKLLTKNPLNKYFIINWKSAIYFLCCYFLKRSLFNSGISVIRK